MKIIIIVLLILSVFSVFSAPTFYEAYMEHRVLKAARVVADDMISARRYSIQSGKDYGVMFAKDKEQGYYVFLDNNSDGTFDQGDTVIKSVNLKNINSHIKFSNLFDSKGVVFRNNTVVFSGSGKTPSVEPSHDSVFIVNERDDRKGITDKIVRIYVNKDTNEIRILRVTDKTDAGDLVFGEIKS
ncbi:MAG: hypothetical protein WCQ47_01690 [bacterium]